MKRNRWVCLLFLLLLLSAVSVSGEQPERPGPVTRCLLIGCDRFASMPSTEPASANNTEVMAGILADFLPEGMAVTRKTGGPASVDELEKLVLETFREAKEGDRSLIYLSTHGVVIPSSGEEQTVVFLLSDGTEEEGISPQRLREILDRVPGEKILILDACHSGAVIGAGAEQSVNWMENGPYRVLVSSGAEEDSWFWSAETDQYAGTGYFTAALENALRASDPEQIDPDGDCSVTLEELTARLREIHGASTVYAWPAESRDPLLTLPADRKPGDRLRGLAFGKPEQDGDALVLPIRFRAENPVRLTYQLVYRLGDRWDFEHAVRLPDREKTGLVRGLLSPGEKERKIRIPAASLKENGGALLQIISLRGDALTPAAEAGRAVSPEAGNLPAEQEKTESE